MAWVDNYAKCPTCGWQHWLRMGARQRCGMCGVWFDKPSARRLLEQAAARKDEAAYRRTAPVGTWR